MSSVSVGATTVAIYSYLGSGRLFGKELSEANVVSRGSSIDSIILRDKDANTAWTTASDGVLEERRYYCQNWRSDVSVIVKTNGDVVEWIKYSAYGVPTRIDPADYNRDNFADAVDSNAFDTDYLATNARADVNFDDSVNVTDYNLFYANWNAPGEMGRGILSRSTCGNRVGYAGYQHATELIGTKWHIRHRVLDSELGKWTRRDPLEYVDGPSLTAYVAGRPIDAADPLGQALEITCTSLCISGVYYGPHSTDLQSTVAGAQFDFKYTPEPRAICPGAGRRAFMIQEVWHEVWEEDYYSRTLTVFAHYWENLGVFSSNMKFKQEDTVRIVAAPIKLTYAGDGFQTGITKIVCAQQLAGADPNDYPGRWQNPPGGRSHPFSGHAPSTTKEPSWWNLLLQDGYRSVAMAYSDGFFGGGLYSKATSYPYPDASDLHFPPTSVDINPDYPGPDCVGTNRASENPASPGFAK